MTMVPNDTSRTEMTKIVSGLPTTSAKIRALGRAGYARADIARFLDIRYQHVRNVLVRDEERQKREAPTEAADGPPRQAWIQVGPDGRLVIPTAYRRLLGVKDGGHVFMLLEGGELRLMGRDRALRRAQELVARYVPEGVSLVDELLAERRREVAREEQQVRAARENRSRE